MEAQTPSGWWIKWTVGPEKTVTGFFQAGLGPALFSSEEDARRFIRLFLKTRSDLTTFEAVPADIAVTAKETESEQTT